MERMLSLFLMLVVGCNPIPGPKPQPGPDPAKPVAIKVVAPPYEDEQPILAQAIAKVTDGTIPTPGPTPTPAGKPKVGDVCPNCDGRGRSGDGILPCKPCGGDGKVDEADLVNFSDNDTSPVPSQENSVLMEYATVKALGELGQATADSLHILNEHFKDLEGRLTTAFGDAQVLIDGVKTTTEANQARINELEASLKALELEVGKIPKPATAPGPAPSNAIMGQSPTTKVGSYHAINWLGKWWYWNADTKRFYNYDTKESIPFGMISDIALVDQVTVCHGSLCMTIPVQHH